MPKGIGYGNSPPKKGKHRGNSDALRPPGKPMPFGKKKKKGGGKTKKKGK